MYVEIVLDFGMSLTLSNKSSQNKCHFSTEIALQKTLDILSNLSKDFVWHLKKEGSCFTGFSA